MRRCGISPLLIMFTPGPAPAMLAKEPRARPNMTRRSRTAMMQAARIWYQSFTDPDADAPYFTRLNEYLQSIAGPGYEIHLFGLRPGDRFLHPITEFRCAAQ